MRGFRAGTAHNAQVVNRAPTRTRRTLAPVAAYLSRALPASRWASLGSAVGGLVVHGASAPRALRRLRDEGYLGPLLVDPAGYAGAARPREGGLLPEQSAEERWLEFYANADVDAVLSPGTLVAAGDAAALDDALARGAAFLREAGAATSRGFVLLALPAAWFARNADRLAESVEAAGVPVAVVGADSNDPFRGRDAVAGLKHLVSSVPRVMLLRSDLAALGAVAHGAVLGAVGVTSTVRHFAPPTGGFGGSRDTTDRSPSVLVPGCAVWARGSLLWSARGDNGMLDCECGVCRGRSLRRFREDALRAEAHLHSVEVWKALTARLLAAAPADRAREWGVMCREAVDSKAQLESRTGVPMRGSALAGWVSIA